MPGSNDASTDILVIGGGSAGCMAAIRAKEVAPDLKVTIFEKGNLSRSGSIAMGMDARNNVVVPGVTTEDDYVEAIRLVTQGVFDPAPHRVIARRSFSVLQRLESWGIEFQREPDGSYYVHQIHINAPFTVPMDAPDLKPTLAARTKQLGVKAIERTMAVALLADDQGVCGAIGLHVRTGDLVVCLAKAVIMTNGGCARFGLPNSGYLFGTVDFPGNAGDGYAIGYRAGAQVTGMEYTVNASLVKDLGTPLLVPVQSMGGIMINSRGEQVQGTKGRAHSSTDVWQSNQANAPLLLRTCHLSEDQIGKIESVLFSTERSIQKRFYEQRGINLREQDIELGLTEHYLCGGHGLAGLAVNERAETTLPGLYAAGDCAGVAYQYLAGAFVLGEVAAEEAAQLVRRRSTPASSPDQVAAVEQVIEDAARSKPAAGVAVDEFEFKVRRIVNDYVVSPKNEWKLQNAIDWMHRFRKELAEVVKINDAHELARYFEIGHIIDSSELSATAAMTRQESRWGSKHYRTDYSERDDAHWLKQILLQPAADGTPRVEFRQVTCHQRRMAPIGVDHED